MTAVTLSTLTEGTLNGAGVFDKLMAATKAHLDEESRKGAIRGPEYAQVYLGQLQAVMQTAIAFLASNQKIDLEVQLLQKQIEQADAQIAQINAQTQLLAEQKANAILEGKVLVAQECKLRAEFDLTQASILKADKETELLAQKTVTEKAQVLGMGVDSDSVIGRQKALYLAQTKGFDRDAEQKVLAQMLQTWSTRRMTDSDGTAADATNKLDDATIGRVVDAVLAGINA